jgi:energy-coupling factor transport system ATP-binding protein
VEHPALLFKNFTFKYRAQSEPTLRDINLSVRRGEKVLILGPSGSGKSTLLHCINGINPHSVKGDITGEFFINGRNSGKLEIFDISKMAGTVLQDTDGQFVGMSAAEDIAFALENDCVPPEELRSRVCETAKLVDMKSHLSKSPQDLSGGQKQRVSLAGVLVDNVDILLFDEPLANLDPAAGKDAIELIDELHKKTGKTILIVEHRLEDVLHRPVDRIVLIDKGRIIADAKPAQLLATDLLYKTGIREPLYISALSYAGVEIKEDIAPESPLTIHFDKQILYKWERELIEGEKGRETKKQAGLSGNALEIRDLHFRYDEKGEEALKGISFSVSKGECVGLVGRNGSGKSTLAKCVCGFVKPDSGSIFYDGKNLAGLSIMQRAEKIGYVMQNPNQMISFPIVFDEAAFGLKNRGISGGEAESKVHETLKICGLYHFRNWPVSALSYGQKKRLTIASIVVLQPSFIILDEPTAGQDYRHYTEFMEFILGLGRDLGISLLLITHDMHLMLEYTTRSVVLSEGECVADREPFEVLTDDEVIAKASLKRTSLYDLALMAGIGEPRNFVRRYIDFDRDYRAKRAMSREKEPTG